MFKVEIKFAADALLKWFNAKIRSKHLELDPFIKIKSQKENTIERLNDKCFICNFLLKINPKYLNFEQSEMSYFDFIIRVCFFEKIFSQEDLEKTNNLKNLELYYSVFQRFLKIIIFIENDLINSNTYDNIYHDELRDILKEYCPSHYDDITGLIEEIKMFELKNKSNTKIPKFTLQISGFVYDTFMKFPLCNFIFETITTKNLFEDVYRLINFKVHIHHSRVTGKT